MDTEHYKQLLLKKDRELRDSIGRYEDEARQSRSAEVEDEIDRVTSDEGKAAGFQESTLATQTLMQVREALERIDNGSYGTCIDCGRPIQPARLEAVPWALYCLEDQQKHDEANAAANSEG